MNEFDVIKIKAEAYKETGGDKGMIDFNTLKCRKTKMGREASWYSLLSSKGIDITFISLIITLLIFGLGGQSAFSQYRDLSVSDVRGVSNRHNSGVFASDGISVS
ncbi:MAG: hypothetical protein ACM3XO_07245, partial [Bacteroidota bacterium]